MQGKPSQRVCKHMHIPGFGEETSGETVQTQEQGSLSWARRKRAGDPGQPPVHRREVQIALTAWASQFSSLEQEVLANAGNLLVPAPSSSLN